MAWYRRLANIFRSVRLNHDLDREIRFHLRERTEDFESRGLSHADARLHARRQFGNPVLEKERTRDMDVIMWLDAVVRNVRLGFRSLARTSGLSVAVILTL